MRIFRRFRKETEKPVTLKPNLADPAKKIESLLDELANNIFLAYRDILISEPITYIIPAVWGDIKGEVLSNEQRAIHARVAPVLEKAFEVMRVDQLEGDLAFAIGSLVRGLIISKVLYMIEALKRRLIIVDVHKKEDRSLEKMEPIGTA